MESLTGSNDYSDPRNPYAVAHAINSIPRGWHYRLDIHDLQNMRGDLWRNPLEIIQENIIGWNHGEIIMRELIETGDLDFYRPFTKEASYDCS